MSKVVFARPNVVGLVLRRSPLDHSATSDAVASWCMLRSGTRRWLPTPRRSRERNKARLAVHRDEVWGDRRHTDHDETLGCAPGEQVIGIVDGATDPELMEQDGQFAGHGHDRSFLGILPAAPGDPLAVSSQVTRRAKRPHDVLRRTDQEPST